jgi:hypothetical protein
MKLAMQAASLHQMKQLQQRCRLKAQGLGLQADLQASLYRRQYTRRL